MPNEETMLWDCNQRGEICFLYPAPYRHREFKNYSIIYISSSQRLCPLPIVQIILLMQLNTVKLSNHPELLDKGASMCIDRVISSTIPIPVIKCRGLRFCLLDLFWLITPGIDWWVTQRWWFVGGDIEGSGLMLVRAMLLQFAHEIQSYRPKVSKHTVSHNFTFTYCILNSQQATKEMCWWSN